MTTVCCSVLRCGAVWCSVVQSVIHIAHTAGVHLNIFSAYTALSHSPATHIDIYVIFTYIHSNQIRVHEYVKYSLLHLECHFFILRSQMMS